MEFNKNFRSAEFVLIMIFDTFDDGFDDLFGLFDERFGNNQ